MSAQATGTLSSQAMQESQQLDNETAGLVTDILPYFTSVAPIEAVWSSERVAFIAERRNAVFGQKLFFDELLSFASIDASLYPPRSTDQLSALLNAIFAAPTLDYLKQLSLVYYLLLELNSYTERNSSDNGNSGIPSSTAERFADTYVVLPQFVDIMQGYWLLDNDRYEEAVPLLAVADFIPKIMCTLFLDSSFSSRSEVARAKLLLRFLRTSNQPTSSPPGSEAYMQEVEMQIQALCFVSGPSRAFSHIRTLTEVIQGDEQQRVSVRARLIFKVLEHCFAPPRSAAIKNLLACSLDPEEEVTLESFILSPPAAMTATWSYVAADVLIVRYISQGRYMDAVGLDRRLGPDVSQGHSSAKNAQQRSKMMEQRKRMIAGAREILPEVQKELLRIEESVEISGGVASQQLEEDKINGASDGAAAANGVSGKNAINDFADRSAIALTPLSASPAARRSKTHTPTTQAAILSAVVRASSSPSAPSTPSKPAGSATASPIGTPSRTLTPQQGPSAMIGFLAKNALSGSRSSLASPSTQAQTTADDEAMEDELEEIDGSAVLVARPTADSSSAVSGPAPASPWRNQPTLTSSSPFSGLPKLSRPAFGGGNTGSVASVSRSPYSGSPHGFQPATTSPFAASTSFRSSSPSVLSSSTAAGRRGAKLTGAMGIVSQHGKKSRLARDEPSFNDDTNQSEDEAEHASANEEDYGDDTFVQSSKQNAKGKAVNDVNIGRLVPGRRGWKESQEDNGDNDDEMQQSLTSPEPPTKRRAGKKSSTATASKLTRSRTGINLADETEPSTPAGSKSKLSKSRSHASLADGGAKRMTRSTSAVNRKPLTLSNLEQHSSQSGGVADAAPIARRTRAATAEMESVTDRSVAGGAGAGEGGSTIYTISEVGDDDDAVPTRSPVKRGGGRKVPAKGANVRRSSRLSSVEPESTMPEMSEVSSPAKRRGGATRKTHGSSSSAATGGNARSKMPGSLE